MPAVLLACQPGDAGKDSSEEPREDPPAASSLIGTGDGTRASVGWTAILGADQDLDDPRDLGFDASGNLWIANRQDDRTFIVFDPGTEEQSWERRKDGYAMHFMEETMAFSFDPGVQFGSCGESLNSYNDRYPPDYFMGPVLWSADLDIFAEQDPIGLGSHLDMNHESPLCMGIAWEVANVYWVFDGYHGNIVRYDFQQDHGVGMDDHSDAIIHRLREPTVERVPQAPGHMMVHHASGWLYVADPGGGRVLRLDIASGEKGPDLRETEEPVQEYAWWEGVRWEEVVTGLDRPGSIAVSTDRLFVGEWGTGVIHEYTLAGEPLRTLDTEVGPEKLYGIELGPDEKLWLVELATPGAWRIDP